ncbi:hypothetical protein [Celeribacter persicus]|uniref:hypothetical protein n=1 Tax=Celeribacter persicus TaxID=1651082 RepID=UPI001FEC3F61|nr:hypothetical protein [Celeribacter persicus]
MTTLEARKAELTSLLADASDDKPDLLPTAAAISVSAYSVLIISASDSGSSNLWAIVHGG